MFNKKYKKRIKELQKRIKELKKELEELNDKHQKELDIIKLISRSTFGCTPIDNSKEPKEMTMSDIEDALGYSVKIVKGDWYDGMTKKDVLDLGKKSNITQYGCVEDKEIWEGYKVLDI